MYNAELGAGYLAQGKLEQANAKLEKALDQNPRNALAHGTYALLQVQLGQPEIAEKHFPRAIRLEPNNSELLNNYGTFLCEQGKVQEAEQHFLKAAANPLYRTPEFAFDNAGVCLSKAENLEQAARHFHSAIEANPHFAPSLLHLAELNYERAQYKSAQSYIERYTKVGPRTPESLWLGVRVYRALGDSDAVANYSLSLKKNFPAAPQTAELLESQ